MKPSVKRLLGQIWGLLNFPLMYVIASFAVYNGYSLLISFIALDQYDPKYGFVPKTVEWLYRRYGTQIAANFDRLYDSGVVALLFAIVVLALVYVLMRKKWRYEAFWTKNSFRLMPILVSGLLGAGLGLLRTGVSFAFLVNDASPMTAVELFGVNQGSNLVIWFIALILLYPLINEFIFRGIVQRRAAAFMPAYIAVLVQAAIFAVTTLDLTEGVFAFILGLVLGLVYIMFDSIWAAVTLHALYNAAMLSSALVMGASSSRNLAAVTVPALLITAAATAVLWVTQKKRTVQGG